MQHLNLPGSVPTMPKAEFGRLLRAAQRLGEFTNKQLQLASRTSRSMARRFTESHCKVIRYTGARLWQRTPVFNLRGCSAQGSDRPIAPPRAESPRSPQTAQDRGAPPPSSSGALRRAAGTAANENAPTVAAGGARSVVTQPE